MPLFHRPRFLFVALLVQLLGARAAFASVDMSGEWYVEFDALGSSVPGHATVTQSGSTLTIVTSLACGSCFPDTSVGTIDPDTGAFSVTSTTFPVGTLVTQGVVAADGYTYSGDLFNDGQPQGSVRGSRCANGVLDPSEDCDDGNRRDFDCCSSTCTFEGAGGSCADDHVECTDSVCDGLGTCTHPLSASGTRCEADGEYCTVETCDGAGGCTTTGFIPAGAPCDSPTGEYFCLSNTCDGAGSCTHTPQNEGASCSADASVCTIDRCVSGACTVVDSVTCGICESCDATDGCVARPRGCTTQNARGARLLLKDDPQLGPLLQWSWPRGQTMPIADLGADSSALGAVLCVIDPATASTVAAVAYPPGSDWSGTPLRAAYRRSTATGSGVAKISRVRPKLPVPELAIAAKAKGTELDLPSLPPASAQLVVELRHGDGVCWSSSFAAGDLVQESATTRRYKR